MRLDKKDALVILDAKDIAEILLAYITEGFGPENVNDALSGLCDREEPRHFAKRISITNGKLITVDVS